MVSPRAGVAPAALRFVPLFFARVWGGQRLGDELGKALPPDAPIGESWELVDRPEAQSVVADGPLAGATLHELWATQRERVFGARAVRAGARFPLLVKLLDARETLSVQVHPPRHIAGPLGGEPKTELWYVAGTAPGAHLLAGLRDGVDERRLTAALAAGEDVSTLLHRLDVTVGDALFVPSGRVHAIGAGCLVLEVQQSSDTTYRVYDFDRPGLDGRPRELHVEKSLASIDFSDVEPGLLPRDERVVVADEHFTVTRRTLAATPERVTADGECALVCVLSGEVACGEARFAPGSSLLVPADGGGDLTAAGPASVLVVELP